MKHLSTCLILLLSWLLVIPNAQAQDVLNPSRVLWSTPLSTSTVKTLVDVAGNTWALSSPNTFQVIDPLGKIRWTKTLSALTVADFAIDQQGQVLLVGLPVAGKPMLEKYDASQTLAWRNTLDSLSNDPAQAGNLSVTINPLGSSIVFGINAITTRKASYYFVSPGGKLAQPVSIVGTKNVSVTPIRPVLVNTNDMIMGINQIDSKDVPPILIRRKVDSLAATFLDILSPYTLPEFALVLKAYPHPPTTQRLLPLISDGQKAFAIAQVNRDTLGMQVPSSTKTVGYAAYKVPGFINPAEYGTPDIKSIGESMSQLLDPQGTLHTTQAISSTGSKVNYDLIINQYGLANLANKQFLQTNSLKVGIFSLPVGVITQAINRLIILKRNLDGSLLLWGTTSSTMTIGSSTFTGTQTSPTQFLMLLGPEAVTQTLSTDQINWETTFPSVVKRVISNDRKQTWVQLSDSTFRYYNGLGKLGWEKKLVVNTIYDAKADLRGNLYVMAIDSISVYDSTGTLKRRFLYQHTQKGYSYQLHVTPSGSGMAVWQTGFPQSIYVSLFNADLQIIAPYYGPIGITYSLRGDFTINPLPLPNQQMMLATRVFPRLQIPYTNFINITGEGLVNLNARFKIRNYLVDNPYPYTDKLVDSTQVLWEWSGFDGKNSSILSSQTYGRYNDGYTLLYGYGFNRFDSTGNNVFDEFNTLRVNNIALSQSRAISPSGTLFLLNTKTRAGTATTTTYDLVLKQYTPNLDLRNTSRLGSFTLPNIQTNQTSLGIVQAYADGSLLLSGSTNGTLTIGTNTYTGSTAQPARFLTLINTMVAQVTAPATAVCQGSSATLKARYKGYLTQPPIVQLADAKGNFASPSLSLAVPLSQSVAVDTTLASLSLPIPATLAAGTYRVRTLVGDLVSEVTTLSITARPAATTLSQQGDELVSTTTTGSYQWYDAQNKPITGATDARYRPQTAGSYYVVNSANGCASLPSNTLGFVILATEPISSVVLYPNPATDQLLVRWPGAGSQARILLLNAQGRVVAEVAQQGEVTQLSTQGLAPGLTVVQLVAEGQATLVYKVLIQR